ncbi:MAG: hypothetical protein R3Y23_02015 [Bacillota bacterium]
MSAYRNKKIVKKGSGIKTFFSLLFGVVLGIVLTLGGIVGVGYMLVSQDIDTVLDMAGVEADFLSDEVKSLTILAYGQNVYSALTDLDNITIGELEEAIGTDALTSTLEDIIGVSASIMATSSLSDIGTTITENLTVATVEEKFGVAFPDIPLFSAESFLSQPLSTAFASIMDYTLDNFIDVVYDADATDELEASSVILQKLGVLTMDEVSTDMDAVIADMTLGELMEIGEDSPKVLQALADCSIETQYNEDDTVATMGISDQISALTLSEMLDTGDTFIWEYLADATLDTMGDKVDNMTIANVIEVLRDDEGNPVCNEDGKLLDVDGETEINAVLAAMITYKYYDETSGDVVSIGLKIDDLGSKMTSIVESLKLGEMIDINDDSEPILIALKDTLLTGEAINETISSLTVGDVFDAESCTSGVLALISSDTLLTDISGDINDAVSNASMYKLIELEIFTSDTSALSPTKKAFFYNSTAESIIQGYIDVLTSGDVSSLAGNIIYIGNAYTDTTITLNNALLNEYNVGWGDTIYFAQNVKIEYGTVFDRIFNIVMMKQGDSIVDNDFKENYADLAVVTATTTLTIGEGVTIEIGEDDDYLDSGYMYISGNVADNGNTITSADAPIGTKTEGEDENAVEVDIPAVYVDMIEATLVVVESDS